MSTPWVSLHAHTAYSELDGLARVSGEKTLFDAAVADRQPAIAMTDHGTLAGAVEFAAGARKAGIKPILGCEIYLAIGSRHERNTIQLPNPDLADGTKTKVYEHLTVLAATATGWRNLVRMHNAAATTFWHKPRLDWDLLAGTRDDGTPLAQGLIVGTGCLGGPVAGALARGEEKTAAANLARLVDIFGRDNVFAEVMDHGIPAERAIIEPLTRLARRFGVRVVATNDSHYTHECDAQAPDMWLAAASSKGGKPVLVSDENRFRFSGSGYHQRTAAQMRALFDSQPGTQDAVANTLLIAAMVDPDVLALPSGPQLPKFPLPPAASGYTSAQWLYMTLREGAVARYGNPLPDRIRGRLRTEFDVITAFGYEDYFLITADVLEWAHRQGIVTGPGRGSAGGSLIAYCLGITGVEPTGANLLFERFLNPDRASMPDIDTDVQSSRLPEVFAYLQSRYGPSHVARIGSFGMTRSRRALKEVGRVTGRVELAARLAKLVPDGPNDLSALRVCLDPANPATAALRSLVAADPQAAALTGHALTLEGVIANSGVHPCGIVVSNEPLDDHIPLRRAANAPDGDRITTFDYRSVEKLLVKMDFLGIDDLDVVATAIETIAVNTGEKLTAAGIIADTTSARARSAYALLAAGDTSGVFQLASEGMARLCRDVRPSCHADISDILALYRPGPMSAGMHLHYAARRHGVEPVEYGLYTERADEAAVIASVLGDTMGLCVYQEQLQRLAVVVADFTAAQSNELQKAFSKKIREKMDQLEAVWQAGGQAATRRDGSAKVAFEAATLSRLWATFKGSADYLFNKSHSYAYGLNSWTMAYLKANWPAEFGAALLRWTDRAKTDKRQSVIASLARCGIEVAAPSLNGSRAATSAGPDKVVRLGLGDIRDVGDVADDIVAQRDSSGPYAGIADLVARVPAVTASTLNALIDAGALDEFGPRAALAITVQAARYAPNAPMPHARWGIVEEAARQRHRIGVNTGEHPLARLRPQLRAWTPPGGGQLTPVHKIPKEPRTRVHTVGVLSAYTERAYSRGRMAHLSIEGSHGCVSGVIWDDVLARLTASGQIPALGSVVAVTGVTKVETALRAEDDDSDETVAEPVLSLTVSAMWSGPLDDPWTAPDGGQLPPVTAETITGDEPGPGDSDPSGGPAEHLRRQEPPGPERGHEPVPEATGPGPDPQASPVEAATLPGPWDPPHPDDPAEPVSRHEPAPPRHAGATAEVVELVSRPRRSALQHDTLAPVVTLRPDTPQGPPVAASYIEWPLPVERAAACGEAPGDPDDGSLDVADTEVACHGAPAGMARVGLGVILGRNTLARLTARYPGLGEPGLHDWVACAPLPQTPGQDWRDIAAADGSHVMRLILAGYGDPHPPVAAMARWLLGSGPRPSGAVATDDRGTSRAASL